MKNIKENEYKIAEENGKNYLHITKELNATLLANKKLGNLMIELIKQNNIKKSSLTKKTNNLDRNKDRKIFIFF